ncbi:hypothetical protein VP1G_02854 [Cytospora mali]|uniref:Uncharacterized protein n=1 Tax=Cytospora mali TaxID=578113 RepID=A0A194UUU9_CYTMA|nr:hypothetical protein VP1G_02854 [Valsa mali var. pyri (nom. inval.)]
MADTAIGRRMLGEIEETSLDEILKALRANLNSTSVEQGSSSTAAPGGNAAPSTSKVKSYPIRDLDTLVTQHFRATQSAPLSLSGRHLPFIYLLVATLVAAPYSKAVIVVDIDAKFDITRVLQCRPHHSSSSAREESAKATISPSETTTAQQHQPPAALPGHTENQATATQAQRVTLEDLKHIHVYRPARGSPSHIRDVLASAEHHMIYSKHASIAREWWGTIVIGGGSPAVLGPRSADVTTGWKGWLRVDHEEIRGFGVGMSIEEALAERDRRQRDVDEAGWTAKCIWGSFQFR